MKIESKIWVPAIMTAAVAAAGTAFWPTQALALLVFALLVIFIWQNPNRLFYLTVALATLALPTFIPTAITVGSVGIKAYELLLLVSVIYASFRYKGRPPIALIAFGGLIALWTMIGLLSQHPPAKVVYDVRNLVMLWLACYVAWRVSGTEVIPGVIRWIKWILWISLGLSILASSALISVAGRVEDASLPVSGSDVGESAVRLLTPATHLSLAVLCVVVVMLISGQYRIKSVLPYLIPALTMVVISFSRNAILGIAVAILFGLIASRTAGSIMKAVGYSLATITVFWLLVSSSSILNQVPGGTWLNSQVEGFSERVLGGLNSDTLSIDNSAQFRFQQENLLIEPRIAEAPIMGHGFGYAYKIPIGIPGTFNADFAPYYAHNFYLWVLAKTGLIGLVVFLWFALLPTVRSLRRTELTVVATGGAILALLATSFVAPMPIGSPTGFILGALIGVCTGQTTASRLDAVGSGHQPEEMKPAIYSSHDR